jgi:hypothetical protein
MERRDDEEGSTGSNGREDFSLVDTVKAICAQNARAELNSEKQLLLFLQSWWSRTYNRPLKDPLLLTYTVEELLYEFYDRIERRSAEEERTNLEGDRIEEEKDKATLDWAEKEELRELEALKNKASKEETKPIQDPTKDPTNVAWMEEQLQQAKRQYGENFGEDIEESFE